jgi:putative phosphoribosyl transferase
MNTDLQNKVKIITCSEEPFADRVEAGQLLAAALSAVSYPQGVVLGIPRGGLIVAREVAHRLNLELDIILARKLGAPFDPELAIGAVTEQGQFYLDKELAGRLRADEHHIQGESQNQRLQIKHSSNVYRKIRPKCQLPGKTVIVVDDGVATGSTMQVALWSIRQEGPQKLIAAIPVGLPNVLMELAKTADEIICLKAPENLGAVGQFYYRFDQVSDEKVMEILQMED